MIFEILTVLIALLVTVITVILVSSLVLKKPSTDEQIPVASTRVPAPILWSENLRNNRNYDAYPPCFDLDINSKAIFSLIMGNNKLQKYKTLLDILSIVLCLKKARMNSCGSSLVVKDRLVQLLGMGADVNDATVKTKIQAFIPGDESDLSKLLRGAMYLIDGIINVILNDKDISKTDRENLVGNVYNFYNDNYPFIYRQCLK
jgi:hypothetical protein